MVKRSVKGKELEIVTLVKKRYYSPPEDEFEKWVEDLLSYLEQTRSSLLSLKDILNLTARIIYRFYGFQEIAIGLRNEKEDLYRYEVLLGFTKEAESAYKQLTYNHDDMATEAKYSFTRLSKHSFFCAVEQHPFENGEEVTFNRPLRLKEERSYSDEFIEGDYFEFHCYDSNNELIGWFELSNPRNKKMPTRGEIKRIEIFANILSMIIERKRYFEKLFDGNVRRP